MSDVAGAVIDGADAVMLSGETAKGKYPFEAVQTMAEIVREAEASIDLEAEEMRQLLVMPHPAPSLEAVCAAAARTANDQRAGGILVITENGEAPRLMSKYRPQVKILAACPSHGVAQGCALYRGVTPIVIPWGHQGAYSSIDVNKIIRAAVVKGQQLGFLKGVSRIVVLHDADIGSGPEMQNWVMRLFDVDDRYSQPFR